jgi:tripartite-type tricarboxylate transporter receptor subunit TctC
MPRRGFVLPIILTTLVPTLFASNLALAQSASQSWPTRDVHVLVPQSAGSALDIVTRAVMEQVSPRLGQSIVVENRTGAGNTIAMAAVARAEPDGYTVLANSATHSLVPVTYTTLPFDTFRDLTPIIPLSNTPLVMVVSSSKGYKNVADFVAAAKEKRGGMNYSSGGVGSITHLAMEAFRLAAGFEAVHVPFKGAVSGSNRAIALSDVPTIKEAGYPEATYNFWVGLFLPSKTPALIMDRLYRASEAALQTSVVKERFVRVGADPLPLDRVGFAKLIHDEFVLNTKVAKAAGVKAN